MTNENNSVAFSSVFLARTFISDAQTAQLAIWGKKLMKMKSVKGTEGNLSFRTRMGFVISGANVALDALTPETVAEVTGVVYGLNKNSVYVKGAITPSHETILHSQIYDLLPEINAVFHAHDTTMIKQAKKLDIPVTEFEQEAGSQQLAEEAVKLLKLNKGAKYFVLKNHGVVALGTTMDEAGNLILPKP